MYALCDRHPNTKAAYAFTKQTDNDILILTLCGHDSTPLGVTLVRQGWRMTSLIPVNSQTKSEMDREYTEMLQKEWDSR